ncbi:sensor histidine kinase [Profundibacterium mesophilum]|uniref:histidine kinase n=1 Tax=Profundibacterium mesophilum KAUST100406-0324 TaxID=1037889 RepID=A0A921TF69_9RHOB|nr:HAMP domain-containing sensor histidine kinase [Profundibacterium mesophilum]KAF0676169.1 two-component system NtrC family C4-dicarboxylate transport sensor histidine kinase DctB [Profundibacterium mesophilum KAUST100406-0324]
MLNSLSGRFLILTTVFVMLAEVLIFVPSVARFREDYLLSRLERAQIASLALLAGDMIDESLEAELLRNAEVFNVVLRRDTVRQLVLSSAIPSPIHATYDLRDTGPIDLIGGAMMDLWSHEDQVIRVIGKPVREAGLLIEVTMATAPLRAAMIDYGLRILALSAVISVLTALLLFLAVRRFLVRPIKGVISAISSYAAAPEDARRIIDPSAGVTELRAAEVALRSMQTQLTGALRQKDRLAQLGSAVAKVSHDLRNVLTTTQLLADRIELSEDPAVRRMAPKLVASIGRAVNICEGTLAFGKAEEPPPALARIALAETVQEVFESEGLAPDAADIALLQDIPPGFTMRADREQLYRILSNLVRNARQAIAGAGGEKVIRIRAREDDSHWYVSVADTGPGLPEKAREHLFTPFQGGARKGGTGLGLAIAAELARGHGGALTLERTGPEGTTFELRLPKTVISLETSQE